MLSYNGDKSYISYINDKGNARIHKGFGREQCITASL